MLNISKLIFNRTLIVFCKKYDGHGHQLLETITIFFDNFFDFEKIIENILKI